LEAFGAPETAEYYDDCSPCTEPMSDTELEFDCNQRTTESTEYYFVDIDADDPDATEIGRFEEDEAGGQSSIFQFLTLSTIATRVSNKKCDPILDFPKSIILTYDDYIKAVENLAMQWEGVSKEKERKRIEREELKKCKEEEW
jgi:hypothetical protein